MHNLIELGPYGKNGEIQMVVETPRGSNIKLHYEPKLGAFTVSRALPLGLIYPYDWGLFPAHEYSRKPSQIDVILTAAMLDHSKSRTTRRRSFDASAFS